MNRILSFLYRFLKPHQFKLFILFISILLSIITKTYNPYLFGRLVNEVFYNKDLTMFGKIILLYCLLFLTNQLIHFLLNYAWVMLKTKFLFSIREKMFAHVLSTKGDVLSTLQSGDIIHRMSHDTEEILEFVHRNILVELVSCIELILTFYMTFKINIWLGLFTMLLTPTLVFISNKFSRKVKLLQQEIINSKGFLVGWLFEVLNRIPEIKIVNAIRHIRTNFIHKSIQLIRLQIKDQMNVFYAERTNSGLFLLAQVIIFSLSALFIRQGKMNLGEFTALVSYFSNCIIIISAINKRIVSMPAKIASINRVIDMFELEVEEKNTNKDNIVIENACLSFDNVFFSFDEKKDILNGLNLEVKPNEIVAIVGRSGAGKSTLVKLINKTYNLSSGVIRINGRNIHDFNLKNLRDQVGIVYQDNTIFNESIRFNLSFCNNPENDSSIWEALKYVNLDAYVRSLPNGLDTLLNPVDVQLSGGQIQRLSIARAFLKLPPILIFDESTSALDNESEQIILSAWRQLCQGRTLIIITHRMSTIINSDRIAVMENGRIVGYDKHEALINNCKSYQKLVYDQFLL